MGREAVQICRGRSHTHLPACRGRSLWRPASPPTRTSSRPAPRRQPRQHEFVCRQRRVVHDPRERNATRQARQGRRRGEGGDRRSPLTEGNKRYVHGNEPNTTGRWTRLQFRWLWVGLHVLCNHGGEIPASGSKRCSKSHAVCRFFLRFRDFCAGPSPKTPPYMVESSTLRNSRALRNLYLDCLSSCHYL